MDPKIDTLYKLRDVNTGDILDRDFVDVVWAKKRAREFMSGYGYLQAIAVIKNDPRLSTQGVVGIQFSDYYLEMKG